MTTTNFPAIGSPVDVLGSDGRPDHRGKVSGYDYCAEYLAWYIIVSLADGQTLYCDPHNLEIVH
jgi:hypothetical protein